MGEYCIATKPCVLLIEDTLFPEHNGGEHDDDDDNDAPVFVCELHPLDPCGGGDLVRLEDPELLHRLSSRLLESSGKVTLETRPGLRVVGSTAYAPDDGPYETVLRDLVGTRRRRRSLSATKGNHTVLALRVVAPDAEPTHSETQLVDFVFGAGWRGIGLKSQMEVCSYRQFAVHPPAATGNNGVYTVPLDQNVTGVPATDVRRWALQVAKAELGELGDQFSFVLLVLPKGPTKMKFAAYAYMNHWLSVYNDGYIKFPDVQMHELGHNVGLGHSGEDGKNYGDHTGVMGGYFCDGPTCMCFNAPKSWELGWYSDRCVSHSSAAVEAQQVSSVWTETLIGVAEYSKAVTTGNNKTMVVVQLEGQHETYHVGFNRAVGVNGGTAEGRDLVHLTVNEGHQSWLLAKLAVSESHQIEFFTNDLDLVVTVLSVDITSMIPGTATVQFEAVSSSSSPSLVPSGFPTAAPSTSAFPSVSLLPSEVPSSLVDPTVRPPGWDALSGGTEAFGDGSFQTSSAAAVSPCSCPNICFLFVMVFVSFCGSFALF